MEADAEGQVDGRDDQQSPESLQQQGHQAHLEHVGVEHHQQHDDDVKQDADVLDAAGGGARRIIVEMKKATKAIKLKRIYVFITILHTHISTHTHTH